VLRRPSVHLAIGALVLVAAAVFVWGREAARRRTTRARAAALQVELATLVPRDVVPHPPLLGEPTDGDATTHYRNAAKAWVDRLAETGHAEALLARTEDPDAWPLIAKALEAGAAALDELAAAATSRTLDVGALWRSRRGTGLANVILSDGQWHALSLAVRSALRAGDHATAVIRTAQLLTWCRDAEFGPPIHVPQVWAAIATVCDAWTDQRLQELAPATLTQFAGVLQKYEETVPPFDRSALACLLDEFETLSRHADEAPTRLLEALNEEMVRLRAAGASWSTRRDHPSPLDRRLAGLPPGHAESLVRQGRARVRLLRLAVAWHRGERLELGDPLADAPFTADERDGAITFRSAGFSTTEPALERTARRR